MTTIGLAENIERLARIFPGVSGYQDKEGARETDRQLRLRLAAELARLERALEEDKKALMNNKTLTLLPDLDRIAGKLNRLANTVTHAARGYRGFFDEFKHDEHTLDRLYEFDFGMFDQLDAVKTVADRLRALRSEPDRMKAAAAELEAAVDLMEAQFSKRADLLTQK